MDSASPREKTTATVLKFPRVMRPSCGQSVCVTTSWDDGHPLDLRVAELLMKYGISGTFYVPRTTEHGTMRPSEMRTLSTIFEIGAHTMRHIVLTETTDEEAWQEISRSKAWIEDTIGSSCLLFCPPRGRYGRRHLDMASRAKYIGLRSTELLSLDRPRQRGGLLLMPTTLQAYPHTRLDFARNAIKRKAAGNLWRCIAHGGGDWARLGESLLRRALAHGGVFHLWGHSWELEKTGQWRRLDDVLRLVGDVAKQAVSLTNGQICRQVSMQSMSPCSGRDARRLAGGTMDAPDIVAPHQSPVHDWNGGRGGDVAP